MSLLQMPPPKRLQQTERASQSVFDINGLILKFLNNFVSSCCLHHLLKFTVICLLFIIMSLNLIP